jgi:hypothetical protein
MGTEPEYNSLLYNTLRGVYGGGALGGLGKSVIVEDDEQAYGVTAPRARCFPALFRLARCEAFSVVVGSNFAVGSGPLFVGDL